jgi:glyoxalase family protein
MSIRSTEKPDPRYAIRGLHHSTAVTADAQRAIDFYTRALGLYVVKRTIDIDDWQSYHVFLSTAPDGRPGTLISLLQWRDAKRGNPGIGGTHHVAFATPDRDSLLRWKRWFTDLVLHQHLHERSRRTDHRDRDGRPRLDDRRARQCAGSDRQATPL